MNVGGTAFSVVENFITPTTAGVTVNGQSLTLSQGAPVQVLNSSGSAYYVRLDGISYLPISQTVTLTLYAQPVVTAKVQNATTNNTVTTTVLPTTVTTVAPVTTAVPANTTAAKPAPASSTLPAIAAMGLTIATAIAVGIAYQRRSTAGRKGKKAKK